MFLVVLLAIPLALTVVAALVAAVPVITLSPDAVADLKRKAARVQPSLVALEVLLVIFYRPSNPNSCGHTGLPAELIPWIALCSMLVGGVVVAASLRHGSRRRLIAGVVVLSYIAGYAFLVQTGPCQN